MTYENQREYPVLGTFTGDKKLIIDTPVTLTGSYAAARSAVIPIAMGEQAILNIAYTMGAAETGNSLNFKIEFSTNGVTYHQDISQTTASGAATLYKLEYTFAATGAAGTYDYIRFPLPIAEGYAKIWVKETGIAANGGLCYVTATVSGK